MKIHSVAAQSARGNSWRVALSLFAVGLARHWLVVFNMLIAIWVITPWLAPVFMRWGWGGAAGAIHSFYSFQCHQLPQRSFFLFGTKPMYSLAEIQFAWQDTADPRILRQWVGNVDLGWKVAWSDRMVSMYTSLFLASMSYWLISKRIKPLSLRGFALLLLPMGLDGGTHTLSDLGGLGRGFRDSNVWLATLTGNSFPSTFYEGDGLGSFNFWMRLLTGVLFGIAVIWLAYPAIQGFFDDYVLLIENKFRGVGLKP